PDLALFRVMRYEVDRGRDRRIVEIDGGRGNAIADGQDGENGLYRTGRAEQMAGGGLGRRHRDLARRIADQTLYRVELDLVAQRRRGPVGIDVVDLGGRDAGALERHGHAAEGAVAILGRRGDVVGVAREAVADHFGIDLGAAALGAFVL